MIPRTARVRIIDPGDRRCGDYGTVTVAEYPAVLTGRPMVDVHLDDTDDWEDEGWYVDQLEETHIFSLRVA